MANSSLPTLIDHDARIDFIKSIQLAEPRYRLPPNFEKRVVRLPPDNKKESHIVPGAVVENVSAHEAKQDSLDTPH